MTVAESINNEIAKGNIKGIRIMMKNSLLVDPTFNEFKEMERLTSNLKGLYDLHDGCEFITDNKAWDDDYMDNQMVQVIRNFSHERLEHLKKVVRYLHPPRSNSQTSSKSNKATSEKGKRENQYQPNLSEYQKQKNEDIKNGRVSNRSAKIAAGSVAGAVAGAVVSTVIGAAWSTIILTAAASAAGAGLVIAIATNGEK